ncbi:MAG: hypothetical protein ACXAD7_07135 [Candidatus Kariarchaeaceae archaeon]
MTELSTSKISGLRLYILVCLALIIEKKELTLDEIIKETSIKFPKVIRAMNALTKLRLVKSLVTSMDFPNFVLEDELEARKFYFELKHQPENLCLPKLV